MNNRQAGRRRGRGGQRPGGSPGRTDNGNRIDNRARGNAAQLLEKYKSLARDAQMSGDRVTTEYYLQFADHYFRVLSETRARSDDGNTRRPSNDISDEDDDDYGFEGEAASPSSYAAQPMIQQDDDREPRRDAGQRRDQTDRSRRPDRDDGGEQGERPRAADRDDGREQGERPRRAARDEGGERVERPRAAERNDGRDQAERPRRSERNDGGDRPQRADRDEAAERTPRPRRVERTQSDDQAPVQREEAPPRETRGYAREAEPREERPVPANDEVREQPRRRGRPRRDAVAEVAAEGFDAALLPPSLNVEATPPAVDGEPVERPRRRRRVQADDEMVPPAA